MPTCTLTNCVNCAAEIDEPIYNGSFGYCEKCYDELFDTCVTCNKVVDHADSREVDDSNYCESCYNDLFTECEHCGKVVNRSEALDGGGAYYCESCYNDLFVECENCGVSIANDETENVGDYSYCRDCFDDLFTTCADCGRVVEYDDCCRDDDGNAYCERCRHHDTWAESAPLPGERVTRTRTLRRYGVELETHTCHDHFELQGVTPFGCKYDGSIAGMEFVSPILQGDEGLEEISRFCGLARRFTVDSACGYHLHIDMERDPSAVKHAALAYSLAAELWGSFVPQSRRRNRYCGQTEWDWDTLKWKKTWDDVRNYTYLFDRYMWCNLAALRSHGTIEIRLHTSTLDANKVNNWVVAHLRFVEWAVNSSYQTIRNTLAGNQWTAFVKIIGDKDITDYLASRAAKWAHSSESGE